MRAFTLGASLVGLVSLLARAASAQSSVPSGADLAALLPARLGEWPRGEVRTYLRFVTAEYPMRDRRRSSLQVHEVIGAGGAAFQGRNCPRTVTVARRPACLRANERLASVTWVIDDAIAVIVGAPDEPSVLALARTLDLGPFARVAARVTREPAAESTFVIGTASAPAPSAAAPPSEPPRPRVVSLPPPAYPPEARARQLEGVVRVRVQIGADGALADATVVAGDPVLAAAALASVRAARFEPARGADGRPVAASTLVSVRFVLD